VLTFHLPFIVAAMVLGGPIGGGWVAFVASFERRELTEMPWYGAVANHSGLALGAIAGGLAAQATVGMELGLGLPGGLAATLVGAAVGTLVLTVVQTVVAAGVIVLRDGLTLRETIHVFDRAFRPTLIAETVLGWLFVVTWVAVGWWAPVLCAALVLALWRTNAAEAERDRDELTGLLTARAFAMRVAEAALRGRRGIEGAAYVFLDLDGFKRVNDGPRSHAVGDEVLAELGERLRRSIRITDAAGRRGGDEFMLLFVGVRDEATALSLAGRVHALVTTPYRTSDGEKHVGASVGVALVVPGERDFEPDLRRRADEAMYEAKGAGGGVRAWSAPSPPIEPQPAA
jgi:diguanylate cyclase (GGDEF)-like protein